MLSLMEYKKSNKNKLLDTTDWWYRGERGRGRAKWVKGVKYMLTRKLDFRWGACDRVHRCQIIILCI